MDAVSWKIDYIGHLLSTAP